MAQTEYRFRGTVLPERYDFNWPLIGATVVVHTGQEIQLQIEIKHSQISVLVAAPADLDIPTIRNSVQSFVGHVVYTAGFIQDQGLDFHIEAFEKLGEPAEQLLDFTGHVFLNRPNDPRLTFPLPGTPVNLTADVIFDTHFSRAAHELRNSIRYPDTTAMHVRAAIEAVRNAFPGNNEKAQWASMRAALALSEATLKSFTDAATKQRHGQNVPQSWEQRQSAMQIGWEVAWRYARFLLGGRASLTDPVL